MGKKCKCHCSSLRHSLILAIISKSALKAFQEAAIYQAVIFSMALANSKQECITINSSQILSKSKLS